MNVQRTHANAPSSLPSTMRAITHDRYGESDVLVLREAETPTPAAGEVLLHVAAAAVNPLDWHMSTGRPYFLRLLFGFRQPRQQVRGADVCGRVVALGEGVTEFAIDDRVAGIANGSFADYATARVANLAVVPDVLSDLEAAAIPLAATTALQALRDQGEVADGQRVLVIGATGGVGSYAVQLAVVMGAEVTGVCSTANVALARSLGAQAVIDYTTEEWADGTRYDVIIDSVGTRSLSACRRALAAGGTYVMIGGPKSNPWIDPLGRVLAGRLRFAFRSRRFRQFTAVIRADDLRVLFGHVEAGHLRPVIDRQIPLAHTPQAIRQCGTGHARGKTVVDIAADREGKS